MPLRNNLFSSTRTLLIAICVPMVVGIAYADLGPARLDPSVAMMCGPSGPSSRYLPPESMTKRQISGVLPEFPAAAVAGKVQGVVSLAVTANTEGRVIVAEPIEGAAVLAKAAVGAVSNWKYRPLIAGNSPAALRGYVVPFFHLEQIIGKLVAALGNGISVERAGLQHAQDQHAPKCREAFHS